MDWAEHYDGEQDRERAGFLTRHLHIAASRLDVTPIGDLTFTGETRTVGIHAQDKTGDVWLRTIIDDPDARRICRWEGNVESNAIHGVPKPEVIRWADWHDPDWHGAGIRLRGEVMTYVPDKPVSDDGDLYADPGLPDTWWTALRQALTALQQHPVPEHDFGWLPEYTAEGVERFFDTHLPMELFTTQVTWTTAHGDLHWVNITGPRLWLLDWECWRRAPAWYDAATLYCSSLFHPPTAQRIHKLFPELDSHSGTIAQLAAIIRYLWISEDPESPVKLHALGQTLVQRLLR
ncbi:MAG: hypothetical protein JO272_00875 [Pseudonocardiales bacterium]|nr:hypothetical protein [Pseudonocardiales bacterium]